MVVYGINSGFTDLHLTQCCRLSGGSALIVANSLKTLSIVSAESEESVGADVSHIRCQIQIQYSLRFIYFGKHWSHSEFIRFHYDYD